MKNWQNILLPKLVLKTLKMQVKEICVIVQVVAYLQLALKRQPTLHNAQVITAGAVPAAQEKMMMAVFLALQASLSGITNA